ncbi:MAG: hypothetical protein A2915_04015 [Candidatus Yanofskybacteria bacterium RIFCSPLOWO2_01_FULL_41_34]|uniref:NlpC/P60 domain-containing protein n=1 Tax=Candidatus Yanofskybacteria bacterium RIFCSPHIGHO2_01_FULL_41_26 TaxID=1802661 RepID=A0A1F8EBH8_9BACT|nr:MAG: hypothetical protein A2649_03110 [Candidatus Yanofskybacteria bacterium RIFCSPHIGHO2_01_FULL_41_26]OGN21575.1 MAG: hypothetical protein A2915_04015 [Candidatus Yanofskybacteria bacterium RIFCSPLOWO2_01_FULL_41_34]
MKLLFKKNYLAQIENSAKGENWMFRNFYVEKDGEMQDVYNDGRWSCGVLVSAILYLQNSTLEFFKKPRWIQYIHANVDSTTKDMLSNGWYEIKELKPGTVVVWDKKLGNDDGKMHAHNGFYVGGDMAISNDSKGTGFPCKHHYTYNGTRKIEKIYWHPELDNE